MSIRDWWNRLLSKFGKKDSDEDAAQDAGPTMELVAQEAPEPVPERKTSDEVIVEMAESTLAEENVRMQEEIPAEEEPLVGEEIPAEEEPLDGEVIPAEDPRAKVQTPEEKVFPEQEEDPWYEEETDNTGEEE